MDDIIRYNKKHENHANVYIDSQIFEKKTQQKPQYLHSLALFTIIQYRIATVEAAHRPLNQRKTRNKKYSREQRKKESEREKRLEAIEKRGREFSR